MQVIHNKKIGISVLAVVVAIGSSASCQRSQSAPKNKSEKLIETPNGKGREVHSGADSPDSSRSSEKHEGATSTPVASESHERRSSIVNDGRHNGTSASSPKISDNPQSEVSEICKHLTDFVSPDGNALVIGKDSRLWREDEFASMLGGNARPLSVVSVYGRKFLFKKNDAPGIPRIIETVLLEIQEQSSKEIFFVLLVISNLDGSEKWTDCSFLISNEINKFKATIYTDENSSLVEYAINEIGQWKGYEKARDVVNVRNLFKTDIMYRYNVNVFNEFK